MAHALARIGGIREFSQWLIKAGITPEVSKGAGEFLRFRAGGALCQVYVNSKGRVTLTGNAQEWFAAFEAGEEPEDAASPILPPIGTEPSAYSAGVAVDMAHRGGITVAELMEGARLTTSAAIRTLVGLEADRVLVRKGGGRHRAFVWERA